MLIGLEADITLLNGKKRKTTTAPGLSGVANVDPVDGSDLPPSTTIYTFNSEIEANYIASVRPRVGVLVGTGLLYATGGVALTTLKYDHSLRASGGLFNGLFEDAHVSETKVGWTAGGGLELPIASNATLKFEYLFTSFGSISTNDNKIFPLGPFGTILATQQGIVLEPRINDAPEVACGVDTGQGSSRFFGGPAPPNPSTPRQCFNHKADFFLHNLRLGLNFKF
jgi:opacity protein-like surface antigen